MRQPRTPETDGPADPWIVEIIVSELGSFLRIPADNVREESSLLSLGLDSLQATTLSHRLRERGIAIQPIDIIRTGSVRGVASALVRESEQDTPSGEESISELD